MTDRAGVIVTLMALCAGLIFLYPALGRAWPVPDTGQTACYDDAGNVIPCPAPGQRFYGQDGNYTINPMSYTKLDAGGNALSDGASSWAMVRDNVTGLIWEVKRNKDGVKNYDDPRDADNIYTWCDPNPETNGGDPGTPGNGSTTFDTYQFINALNTANFGGYSDWRMPTIKELASIVDLSIIPYPGPTIRTAYFPNTAEPWYWSSTSRARYNWYAWRVDFRSADSSYYNKSYSHPVRAVRGGQALQSLADNGNGTVTDTATGLTWQQATAPGTYTWEQALDYCENLTLGGRSDWRLPTLKELRSIVDYSRYNPAINTDFFPDTVTFGHWSSTTFVNQTRHAWVMFFDYGNDDGGAFGKNYSRYVRAVRGGQYGALGNLAISAESLQQVAVPFSVTVTARDGYGNLRMDASGDVWLSATMGDVYPNKLTMAGGVATGNIEIRRPGLGYLYASGVGLSGAGGLMDVEGAGYYTARIKGYVETVNRTRIAGAEVFLEAEDGGSIVKTTSDANGAFGFNSVARIPYRIWAETPDGRKSSRLSVFGDFSLVYLTVDEWATDKVPVLLVPGIMGSSTGYDLYPILPATRPKWSSSKWHSKSNGLHDPFGRVGWRKLKEALKDEHGLDCYEVPYDWRLDLGDIVDDYLIKQIDEAKKKSGADRVDIVAHSMGGLVVRKYIQDNLKYRNDIRNLVMVGTPNHGAANAYYMYFGGDPGSADRHGSLFSGKILNFYGITTELNYKNMHKEDLFWGNYGFDWDNATAQKKAKEFIRAQCPSMRTLLPTYSFLKTKTTGLPALEDNETLIGLNDDFNIDFSDKGVNVMILAGKGEKTAEWIEVGGMNTFYPEGAPRYVQERPRAGDGTVLESSARLGSVFFVNSKEGGHSGLIRTYLKEIKGFIAEGVCPTALLDNAFAETIVKTEAESEEEAFVNIFFSGDIRMLLTDPLGRKLGVDSDGETFFDDFGNAYAMQETGTGNLMIPEPADGVYTLTVSGETAGQYLLTMGFMNHETSDRDEAVGYHHGATTTRTFTVAASNEDPLVIAKNPGVPQNIAADTAGDGPDVRTRLSWDTVPSAVGYRVYGRPADDPFLYFLGESAATSYDTDHAWAGLPDLEVWMYAVSALKADGTESFLSRLAKNDDRDHDGLPDVIEIELGTDINNPDTDGDGLTDAEEVYKYGTSPLLVDTDGDGYSDLQEILAGSDPLDPDSIPLKGDLNADGYVDLADVITGLQVGVGMTPAVGPMTADVNGDGKIGLEEAIYILETVAGVR